jgi:hypothetical protein
VQLWRSELLWVYPGSRALGSDTIISTRLLDDQSVAGLDAPCPRSPQRFRYHSRAVEIRMRTNGSPLCDTNAFRDAAHCLCSYQSAT